MSIKQKVEAGFQLVAKDFHTGSMIVDALIDKIVAAVNKIDANKDGISDVAEFVPVVLKVFPKIVTLWNLVDTNTLVQLLSASAVFKAVDNAQVQAAISEIAAAIKAAEGAVPPKAS